MTNWSQDRFWLDTSSTLKLRMIVPPYFMKSLK